MNDSYELYHFGIKGMKWGVRRFQRKDGTLTNAGKKRYDDAENKSSKNPITNHRNNLVKKYLDDGYSRENAEKAANRQIKTEIAVAAVATVAVSVVATKAARRIGQDYFDKTIKSGTTIQNIGAYEKADFKNNPFYAAVSKGDKKAYASMYPSEKKLMEAMRGNETADIYKNVIRVDKDTKIASVNNAKKVFEEKMKTDAKFREDVVSTLKKTKYGVSDKSVDSYVQTGKVSNKLYDRFNQALATPEVQSAGLHKRYYDALKSKGYDGILDINDTRYSGYKGIAKNPTIIFNGEKISKMQATKIGDEEMVSNRIKYLVGVGAKQTAKKYGAIAGVTYASLTAYNRKKIDEYVKEHPNTKLSDKEILQIVNK